MNNLLKHIAVAFLGEEQNGSRKGRTFDDKVLIRKEITEKRTMVV